MWFIYKGNSLPSIIFFITRVKVAQEFQEMEAPSEELSPGQPFQPDFIYDMLRDLKSDCLKVKNFDMYET